MKAKKLLKQYNDDIGVRLRVARLEAFMSQEQVGEIVGVSFQQVQKYERGIDRISAASICLLSEKLNKPMDYFFNKSKVVEDLEEKANRGAILKTAIALLDIEDAEVRKRVTSLIYTLSKVEAPAIT